MLVDLATGAPSRRSTKARETAAAGLGLEPEFGANAPSRGAPRSDRPHDLAHLAARTRGMSVAMISRVLRSLALLMLVGACDVGAGGPARGAPDATPDASADPGTPDAAPASGATCATPGLLFCDDFETTAPGPAASARWTTEAQGGSLTIDGVHARGARALHVHTDGSGRAMIRVPGFAPPGNSFFGRARVWVTAFPSAPAYAHFTMVEASGNGGGVVRPIGGQYIPDQGAARSLWGVGADGGPTGDWTRWQVTAPAEAGRWLCLEWQLRAADDGVDVWIDGVARPELGVSRTVHGGAAVDFVFPTFTQIWIGWWLYQGGSTPAQFDLWYDDVALATARLGC
jgi:hypothetical protein